MTNPDSPDNQAKDSELRDIMLMIPVRRGDSVAEMKHAQIRALIKQWAAQEANKARIDEASHYCDEGHYHEKERDIAMLPSERVKELTAEKGSSDGKQC